MKKKSIIDMVKEDKIKILESVEEIKKLAERDKDQILKSNTYSILQVHLSSYQHSNSTRPS